jgi:hypothetical protein
VSEIVIVSFDRMRELTVLDVYWVGPELRLGIYVDIDADDAPLLDEARRRMALTTTASGAIG